VRSAFTLIEMTIVLGLMALFASLAVSSFESWRSTSALQQAVSEVVTMLRRASRQSHYLGVPYKIAWDSSTRQLAGYRCELSSDRLSSSWVFDLRVELGSLVVVTEPGASQTWVVDVGAGVVSETGEPLASQVLAISVASTGSSGRHTRRLTLEPSGELTVEMAPEGSET
jgi:prepilin-type N-terminal cleavage/methylation domain-containing protein